MRTALTAALDLLQDILVTLDRLPSALADTLYQEIRGGAHFHCVFDQARALRAGLEKGVIAYDRQACDPLLEQDRLLARQQLSLLRLWVMTAAFEDQRLRIETQEVDERGHALRVESSLRREWLYWITQAQDHAARMREALSQHGIALEMPEDKAPGRVLFGREEGDENIPPSAH